MKAAILREYGLQNPLSIEEIPVPSITEGTLLIKVKACSLNFRDIWIRRGAYIGSISLPYIMGTDVSGIVMEAHSSVLSYKPGDELIISPNVSCGSCIYCKSGEDGFCTEFRILDGGYAEYMVVPERNVLRKPASFTFVEAATLPLVSITAWQIVVNRAQIKAGQTILLWGASSGVGTIALQIAKYFQCQVIAVAGNEEKQKQLRELGANYTVNYHSKQFVEEVLHLTSGIGVDVVVDPIGKESWERSCRLL
jgi:NADPH:quinone reductase-like Zn-dependent oxidoreductase